MRLFFGSTGSAHVLFSKKAREIFKDKQTGDKIIEQIAIKKASLSKGENITIEISGEASQRQRIITLEGTSEMTVE